jgi:hypothetical protein
MGGDFAPMGWRDPEERHGFAGTLRRLGGMGGHFGAPHVYRKAMLEGLPVFTTWPVGFSLPVA